MQVRKYLHNNKQVNNLKKTRKEPPSSARLTQKKNNKTKQRISKSKSRSRSSKENTKLRKSNSKSVHKVSPLHLKKFNILNNSPNSHKKKKKKTQKSKQKNKNSSRPLTSCRQFEKNSHSISTKLVTDRSPLKTNKETSPNPRPSNMKKKKNKKIKENPCTQQKREGNQIKTVNENGKKCKKQIPKIKTIFSMRRQSYFDPQILEKLSLNQKISNKVSSRMYEQSQPKTFRYTTQSLRQYGTSTQDLEQNTNKIDVKDLQFLRKEQQMKWRIMYLELNQLRNNRTPQKIQQIINQSQKNLSQFQIATQKIRDNVKLKTDYVFQSPSKVQKALRRERKSIQQTKQLLKNMSDQKLLSQLEKVDSIQISNIQEINQPQQFNPSEHISIHKQDNPSSSFCIQFEKQLQQFTKKNEPFEHMQITYIPQLQYQKANEICDLVELNLLMEFCQDLIHNEKILHGYLQYLKQNSALPKIQCTSEYSVQLAHGLFTFMVEKDYVVQFLARLNVPFGNSPEVNLKWVRNFFTDDSQDVVEIQNTPQPVLSGDILGEYDENKYTVPSEGQYFFNHCIYGCIGELLDYHRPGGLSGLPPLQNSPKKMITDYPQICKNVINNLIQILQIQMGRTDFNLQLEDPVQITQKSYEMMDRCLVMQQQLKWRRNDDNIFQNKYFLSASIIEHILNEQILMLYNEFI